MSRQAVTSNGVPIPFTPELFAPLELLPPPPPPPQPPPPPPVFPIGWDGGHVGGLVEGVPVSMTLRTAMQLTTLPLSFVTRT